MSNLCDKLRSYTEEVFSMPFEISTFSEAGETCYTCAPKNEDQSFFEVKIYIHNRIRIISEVSPQKHARPLLETYSKASVEKRFLFFDYFNMLEELGAKIKFLVNGSAKFSAENWPTDWRMFSCRITKIPLTDDNDWADEFDILSNWLKHTINLFYTLLTIKDVDPYTDGDASFCVRESVGTMGYLEGNLTKVTVNKYERNPINRELCLSKKGYCCCVCGFNFREHYGLIGKKFIEVHHVIPVSQLGANYIINIDDDLVPVCSNCHSMLHRTDPPLLPEKLKSIIEESKKSILMGMVYSGNVESVISCGKIAVGLKHDEELAQQVSKIKYILLHNWQNTNAFLYRVGVNKTLVSENDVPAQYHKIYKSGAAKFILLDFDKDANLFSPDYDILHLQPKDRHKRYSLDFISIDDLKRSI